RDPCPVRGSRIPVRTALRAARRRRGPGGRNQMNTTRLSIVERVALALLALVIFSAGLTSFGGDGWWRMPIGLVLCAAGLAIAAALVLVTVRAGRPDDGVISDSRVPDDGS